MLVLREDFSGSDDKIIKMARISYDKETIDDKREFIKKLLINKHTTPFEHCSVTYYMEIPIFVARQLIRYRTSVVNEKSGRYTLMRRCYIPIFKDEKMFNEYKEVIDKSFCVYNNLISNGISKEVARMVLPLSMYTKWYYTINLKNLMNLFDQRINIHTQKETKDIAIEMLELIENIYPITINLYKELNVNI